jgi:hypothetical protein
MSVYRNRIEREIFYTYIWEAHDGSAAAMTVAARLLGSTTAAQAEKEEEASSKPKAGGKMRWINPTE